MLGFYLSILVCVLSVNSDGNQFFSQSSEVTEYFCNGNDKIASKFYFGLFSPYSVTIFKELEATTEIKVKLDSGGTIIFGDLYKDAPKSAKFTDKDLINNIYTFILRQNSANFTFSVKGRGVLNHPPYILSLKIDGEENCNNPNRTYFGEHGAISFWSEAPDKFCGRRRINREFTELIVSGTPSSNGDWPWHAAIYRRNGYKVEYTCGGTLISELLVLTAAHCATYKGRPLNPQIFTVVLGKFHLNDVESTNQNRLVFEVIVHDEFKESHLDYDIALLKLTSEVFYNNYVQPACLWFDKVYDQLESYEIMGTVIGWGVDESDAPPSELHFAKVPLVPNLTCVTYEPVFYTNMLTDKKFCAGHANGTAACNGDSGGGFHVFVSDYKYYIGPYNGAWYVRGIVSVTLKRSGSSLCEPKAYTILTDVSKFRDWILRYMD